MTSTWSQALDDSALDGEDIGESVPLRRGRRSPSPRRSGMFSGIAHLFGRDTGGDASSIHRPPSISQYSRTSSSRLWGRRSDAGSEVGSEVSGEGDDRWG